MAKPEADDGAGFAESVGKKSISRIDALAFGKKLVDWLNDNRRDTKWLAGQYILPERGSAQRVLDQLASGSISSADDAKAVAAFCGFEVPMTSKEKAKPSPFGGGRGRGGKTNNAPPPIADEE